MTTFPNIPETIKRKFEPFEITADGRRIVGFPEARDRRALPDLVKIYTEKTGIKRFLEVGSWAGTTALLMAHDNPDVTIFCVDTWKGSPGDATGALAQEIGQKTMFTTFCRNVGDLLYDRIIPCVGRSNTYSELWPSKLAGVFIDADHSFHGCLSDMEGWWPHVADNGVLCGHDYNTFPEVAQAVKHFIKERYLPAEQVHGDVWWIPKDATATI